VAQAVNWPRPRVTRTAGGGLVTVTMGRQRPEVIQVAFDPAVFDESDPESLGALTLAAIGHCD